MNELAEKIVSRALYLRNAVRNGRRWNNPEEVALEDIEDIREILDELEKELENG